MYKQWPYKKNKPITERFDYLLDYMRAHGGVAMVADIMADMGMNMADVDRLVTFGNAHGKPSEIEIDEEGGHWLKMAERAKEGGA